LLTLLSETVLWWHWIVIGLILLAVEMGVGTFLFLGLGLAAAIVGVMDYLFATSFLVELLTWTAFSILVLASWVRWFKEPTMATTGQSDHGLDIEGTVSVAIEPHRRGKVIFDSPVLGNTLWHASSDTTIAKGERVRIVEVNGQLIDVTPV
jgi:membrane protein implicated in regulation of membrane protease activity